MTLTRSAPPKGNDRDLLFAHVRSLPYFRGLLRAVESRFYERLDLPKPVYDLGCGDGHFASLTFRHPVEVGLDPWRGPIHEARRRGAHRGLVQADAARAPFPSACFGSAFSNSVLEHIDHVQDVLNETARLLKPGAAFVFCVPNDDFPKLLSVARFLDRLGLRWMGRVYRSLFNRISRHVHCDPPSIWEPRLEAAGFSIERSWTYFSPAALAVLEWGHFFGVPSLLCKLLFGRWIMAPWRANLWLTLRLVRRYYDEPVPQIRGAYTFYVARRAAAAPTQPRGEAR